MENKEIEKLKSIVKQLSNEVEHYKEKYRRLLFGAGSKPRFTLSPFCKNEDIDVWYPFDYDVKKDDIFEVIAIKKLEFSDGDIHTSFTLRRVRK